MNDTAFPRRDRALGLRPHRAERPQRGDRSLRDDDRYLFLEAILSARETLYLSYSGLSPRDNSEIAAVGGRRASCSTTSRASSSLPTDLCSRAPPPALQRRLLRERCAPLQLLRRQRRGRTHEARQPRNVAPSLRRAAAAGPRAGVARSRRSISSPISSRMPAQLFPEKRPASGLPHASSRSPMREPPGLDGLTRYQLRER